MKDGWDDKALQDVVTVVNGGTPKSGVAEYWGGSNQWLTPKEMGKMVGREITTTERTITNDGLSHSSARLIPEGSVILSTRAPIGHLAINRAPMAFNQGCRGLIPNQDNLDIEFLYYFLLANKSQLNELGTGTTFKELSATKLKEVVIPLPPLEEQKRIVSILDQAFEGLDRARANAEANLESAKKVFEAGITSLLDVKAPQTNLGNLVTFHNGDRGKNYPNSNEYVSEGIPWINTGHILPDGRLNADKMNFISRSKFEQLRGGKIQSGDLVFCLRGATIGKTAFVSPYAEGAIASSLMIIRSGEAICPRYLYYFLSNRPGKSEILRFIGGAAQPNLAGASVGKFKIRLPDLDMQKQIVKTMDKLQSTKSELMVNYEAQANELESLKQALLQKAFSGELT